MAKSRETFNKKSKEQKKQKQRQEKWDKMEERRRNAQKGKSLQEMMAYVDENGNISDVPLPLANIEAMSKGLTVPGIRK
jgi:hypothetical protein